MVVDGNLNVNLAAGSDFVSWGTIIVKGTLTLSNAQLIVHGGVSVGSPPVGFSTVVAKGWWER